MSHELAGQSRAKSQAGAKAAIGSYLARFDEGEVLRWAFRGLLIGTIGVLVMDYYELQSQAPEEAQQIAAPEIVTPLLPPIADPAVPAQGDPRTLFTGDQQALRQPISFTLGSGGVLQATGTIDPGAELRLNAELETRGEYVKTLSLNSPGGSVEDAMAMGKLLRENGISAEVIDGALCASSCPLLLAGGKQRLVGANAAIGVHQFYAVSSPDGIRPPGAAKAMSDAQATTARITRYLTDLGVDPALWLHAMDTPPQSLYYLSQDELEKYKLSTGRPNATPQAPS